MELPPDLRILIEGMQRELAQLRVENIQLREDNAQLKQEVSDLKKEVARLKGLKGPPDIKPNVTPSGMDKGTNPKNGGQERKRRGEKQHRVVVEDRVLQPQQVPPGSRFCGYEDYTVQDIILKALAIRYRRARWQTPEGQYVVADLPTGVTDHVGGELKRLILMLYHQEQTTIPRLVEFLDALGLDVSERKIVRILTEEAARFKAEVLDVLRVAFGQMASWCSVDDTGARHKGQNGICTQIGNHLFTFFATTRSKSRINFLELLRAGHTDYVLHDEAFAYMREHNMPGWVIDKLQEHPARRFTDQKAWMEHIEAIGLTQVRVAPNPVQVATEGALWGSVKDHGFLRDSVILSDDAGQFNVGIHALCWVHAERLLHKLNIFESDAQNIKEQVRTQIWGLYKDLKAYKETPNTADKKILRQRFDKVFGQKTGITAIDRLLSRLRANKPELLRVLDYPDIPLHTNGSENDIRCHVTRRKVSGTTRSDKGRDARDAFLSLKKTCMKLDISFWDYLGDRLGVLPYGTVPPLSEVVANRT
jgi:hypothetical protein